MRDIMIRRNRALSPLVSDFFGDFGRDFHSFFDLRPGEATKRFSPQCEVKDQADHFLVSFDVPGVAKEDLDIEIIDGGVKVSGERKHEESENGYSEKYYGRFERFIALPSEIKDDQVQGELKDGVLSLQLPKKEKSSRKVTLS